MRPNNRKEKIEFLKGLHAGKRKLSELGQGQQHSYVFVQGMDGMYSGHGMNLTDVQIRDLPGPGHVVIIMNPHLDDLNCDTNK